jgi:hypothetical protein
MELHNMGVDVSCSVCVGFDAKPCGWTVAAHPSLGQPRRAEAEEIGRLLWSE